MYGTNFDADYERVLAKAKKKEPCGYICLECPFDDCVISASNKCEAKMQSERAMKRMDRNKKIGERVL